MSSAGAPCNKGRCSTMSPTRRGQTSNLVAARLSPSTSAIDAIRLRPLRLLVLSGRMCSAPEAHRDVREIARDGGGVAEVLVNRGRTGGGLSGATLSIGSRPSREGKIWATMGAECEAMSLERVKRFFVGDGVGCLAVVSPRTSLLVLRFPKVPPAPPSNLLGPRLIPSSSERDPSEDERLRWPGCEGQGRGRSSTRRLGVWGGYPRVNTATRQARSRARTDSGDDGAKCMSTRANARKIALAFRRPESIFNL